jgi:CheY-like chemotaxis protein
MLRILVADDDAAQLDLQCHLLEASGYRVLVAFSPGEALRQLADADLVITDLRFPNPEGHRDPALGLTLIRNIRESGCRAPVIVISGWPGDLEGRPEERLVSRVMAKPVPLPELLQVIGELVTGASAPFQNPLSASP